jgi:uncharacterized delta-60 repeat protein
MSAVALVAERPAGASDGSLDPTFGTGGVVTTDFSYNDDEGYGLAVDDLGRIVLAGHSRWVYPMNMTVARYLPDGSLDPSFGSGGRAVLTSVARVYTRAVALDDLGRIVAVGTAGAGVAVARLLPDGTPDTTWSASPEGIRLISIPGVAPSISNVQGLAIDELGRVVFSGSWWRSWGNSVGFVARLLPTGSLDTSYGIDGVAWIDLTNNLTMRSLVLDNEGRAVAGGTDGVALVLARFTTDGRPDTTFDEDGVALYDPSTRFELASALAVDSFGRVLAGAVAGDPGRFAVLRVLDDGTADAGFGGGDGWSTIENSLSSEGAQAIQLDHNGRIVVAGWPENPAVHFGVARFLPDGTPDPNFGTNRLLATPAIGVGAFAYEAAFVDPYHLVVAGWAQVPGTNRDFALAKYVMETAAAPTVTAPDDVDATTDPGLCTGTVSVTPFTVTGTPEPEVVITTDRPDAPVITQATTSAVFPLGETVVTATATNDTGTASDSYAVTVSDDENPTLGAVAGVSVNATGPTGAVVTFTLPTATDNCPRVSVSVTPASGSLFAIGDTSVSVTATDASDNTTSTTFTVHVAGAAEQLAALRLLVQGVGPGKALADQVDRAIAYLAAGNPTAACVQLTGFVKTVNAQAGKTIPRPLATLLIGEATRIGTVIGC